MATNFASLNILITCFLLLFYTFSTSTHIPLDPFDIDQFDLDNALDEDNIFLPSQNLPEPDSHPAQEATHHHSNNEEPKTKTTTETLEESKPLPLTVFRFGPIDRSRFPRRPLPISSGRHVRHRCHHTQHHYNPHLPRHEKEVQMRQMKDLDKEFDAAANEGEAREIQDDWMGFEDNIDEPISISRKRSKAMEKSELLKRIHTRYNQLRREEAEKNSKENNGSTFVKRIRKFLQGI